LIARHKTAWRTLFDSERAAAKASGIDEIVYLNERGEIAEASASSLFARIGGTFYTPPLSSGALDGCLRRALLESGQCAERVLTPRDLETADGVYLGNSLRGLVRAVPVTAA
jgi:branched-subunit amino acid aminotransferase/4-amino-4-deoxychorismate lyase